MNKAKISFSTAALFPRDTLESLKLIERVGFSYAELMPQCKEETTPNFARRILEEVKVKVGSIHFPLVFFSIFYNPYPGMVREARKMIDDLVYSAEILGSTVIVIHPPYFADNVIKNVFEQVVLDNVKYLCKKGKEHGVKIALENSPKGGRTPGEILGTIQKLDCDNIFPMIDTTEAVESEQDPVKMIRDLEIIHIHVSDHKGSDKHIPPGEGSLDWRGIAVALKEKNYLGFVTAEPAYKHYLQRPLLQLQKTLKFLEEVLR